QFGKQDLCTNEETASFCKQNYKITFQMFRKVNVKGNGIHPLFAYVTIATNRILTKPIKWNFTKFLINKEGKVIRRYAPQTKPKKNSKRYRKSLKKIKELKSRNHLYAGYKLTL